MTIKILHQCKLALPKNLLISILILILFLPRIYDMWSISTLRYTLLLKILLYSKESQTTFLDQKNTLPLPMNRFFFDLISMPQWSQSQVGGSEWLTQLISDQSNGIERCEEIRMLEFFLVQIECYLRQVRCRGFKYPYGMIY